jgi:hypothetical protein
MPPILVNAIKILPLSVSANGYLDSGSPMRAYVKVPSEVTAINQVALTLAFRQFMAPATAASSGGGSTSGSKALTVAMQSSGLGLSSGTSGDASTGTAHTHTSGSYRGTLDETAIADIDPHDHTTPNHTHGLAYGTYEESYPASHSVKVKVYQRVSSTWTLVYTSASQTADLVDLDLTSAITGPGDWRLEVLSDAAQPNGGRLGLDLFGTLELVI